MFAMPPFGMNPLSFPQGTERTRKSPEVESPEAKASKSKADARKAEQVRHAPPPRAGKLAERETEERLLRMQMEQRKPKE